MILDIKHRPGVYFYESNPTIIEGSEYGIKCLADGNPTALNTSIVKHEYPELKKSCGKSTCSLHIGGLRHDSGNYTCTAMNDVGEGILVLYPPDVKVYLQAKRLQCTARGIPDNSTFLFWKHFSHQGTHLRTFEGSEYFQLSLSLNRYLLNGLYLCEATNGIPDSAGNIVSRGNYSVQFSGKPEILPRTNQVQFGNYNDLTTLKIYVYSIPPLSDIKIIRNESLIEKSRLLTKTYHFIKENIFGKDVLIKGYTISLQIPTAVARDFGNYTFLLFNAKGSQAFTTQLTFNGDDNKKTGEVDEKNFLSGYLIGISVGSALVGVVITSLLCLCIRIMKKKAHSLTIHTQENDTHYDEIGENVESLHQINAINEVGEVGISVSRNSEAIRHETPSDEHLRIELSAAMATEYLEPTTKDDSGDDTSINSSTEVELRQINVYEKNDEYSKSSEESSSQQKRNIYLNVQTELRNSYQCLVK